MHTSTPTCYGVSLASQKQEISSTPQFSQQTTNTSRP